MRPSTSRWNGRPGRDCEGYNVCERLVGIEEHLGAVGGGAGNGKKKLTGANINLQGDTFVQMAECTPRIC